MSARGPITHPDGPENRKLLLAARAGNLTLLKTALAAGAHPDAVATVKKESALEVAMTRGDAAMVQTLLEAGAQVWGNPAINAGLALTTSYWGPYIEAFKTEEAYGLWPLLWKNRGPDTNPDALFTAAFAASRARRREAFIAIFHHCQSHPALTQTITRTRWMAWALLSGDPTYAQEVERVMGKLSPFEMSEALLRDHGLVSQPDKQVILSVRYAMKRIAKDALALRHTLFGSDADRLENCMALWWIGKARKERVALVGELLKQHPALGRSLKKHTFFLLCRSARRGSPAIMQEVMRWVGVSNLEPWHEGVNDKGEPQNLWAQVLNNHGPVAARMGYFALGHGLAPLVNHPLDAKGRTVLHCASTLQVSKPGAVEGFLDALLAHGARLDLQDQDGETAEVALLKKGFAAWVARQRERTLQENFQVESQAPTPSRASLRF